MRPDGAGFSDQGPSLAPPGTFAEPKPTTVRNGAERRPSLRAVLRRIQGRSGARQREAVVTEGRSQCGQSPPGESLENKSGRGLRTFAGPAARLLEE